VHIFSIQNTKTKPQEPVNPDFIELQAPNTPPTQKNP